MSCSRFKQSKNAKLKTRVYVMGCFLEFLVIFRYIWEEIVFLKGFVKLIEIRNILLLVPIFAYSKICKKY